jgi:hypothetical protein
MNRGRRKRETSQKQPNQTAILIVSSCQVFLIPEVSGSGPAGAKCQGSAGRFSDQLSKERCMGISFDFGESISESSLWVLREGGRPLTGVVLGRVNWETEWEVRDMEITRALASGEGSPESDTGMFRHSRSLVSLS